MAALVEGLGRSSTPPRSPPAHPFAASHGINDASYTVIKPRNLIMLTLCLASNAHPRRRRLGDERAGEEQSQSRGASSAQSHPMPAAPRCGCEWSVADREPGRPRHSPVSGGGGRLEPQPLGPGCGPQGELSDHDAYVIETKQERRVLSAPIFESRAGFGEPEDPVLPSWGLPAWPGRASVAVAKAHEIQGSPRRLHTHRFTHPRRIGRALEGSDFSSPDRRRSQVKIDV